MNKDFLINNQDISSYISLLLRFQKTMNLIGESTKNDIIERHILDSLQLKEYIDINGGTIFDFGTGAGFPGIILAIFDKNNTYYLFEANTKKSVFLEECKRVLNLNNVFIINQRIEDYLKKQNLKADIIVSRAMAKLEDLLSLAKECLKKSGVCLFLKGESYKKEIEDAKKPHSLFSFEIIDSKINNSGKIIICKLRDLNNGQ